jgi:hypothetical protein
MLQAQGAKPDIPDIPAGQTYYSQLRRVIDTRHVQEKQSADDWLRYLRKPQRRVHEDELKFTGLGDLLRSKGRGKVTKTELREHLDANEIRVQELTRDDVTRGGERTKFSTYTLPGAENYREVLLTKLGRLSYVDSFIHLYIKSKSEAERRAASRREMNGGLKVSVRAGTVPGEWSVVEKTPIRSQEFTGGHWDEPNVLAHLRLSDRTTGGKRTLLVEEVQSDWAQKGRSEGFAEPVRPTAELRAREQGQYWAVETLAGQLVTNVHRFRADRPEGQRTGGRLSEAEAIAEARRRITEAPKTIHEGIPSAPFVEQTGKWTRLALKRVLKMAADEGYDRVGIVRGAEQAERYDLSQRVSRIKWNEKAGLLRADDLSGEEVITKEGVTRANLSDYIGKEAAERLMARKPATKTHDVIQTEHKAFDVVDDGGNFINRFSTRSMAEKYIRGLGDRRELSGVDLHIGGEGMKAFYDVIVPEQLNKLAKEYGVKVQIEGGKTGETKWKVDKEGGNWVVRQPNGEPFTDSRGVITFMTFGMAEKYLRENLGQKEGIPIHTLDVPEPMKERVKKKGFPLVGGTLRDLMTRTA